MRNAFARQLVEVAAADDRIVLLSGDIGNRLFDPFKQRFPTRFFNCGVAEANMMGMAAGLAMCGLRPIVYTITPFVTTRCLEQIRVDVCYHRQPVVIVGVGGGLSYASLGATHHSCEDIALLRALPEMCVVCPADRTETALALSAAVACDGPVYLRLGKKNEPDVHASPPNFEIGKALPLRSGKDVALLAAGNITPVAIAAAERLRGEQHESAVYSFHTVKPLDTTLLEQLFSSCRVVATVEEHSVMGGLGGAVAEWYADRDPSAAPARLVRIGTPDRFLHATGDQAFARTQCGLTEEAIAARILDVL